MMKSGIGGRTAGAQNLPRKEPTSIHEIQGNFLDQGRLLSSQFHLPAGLRSWGLWYGVCWGSNLTSSPRKVQLQPIVYLTIIRRSHHLPRVPDPLPPQYSVSRK